MRRKISRSKVRELFYLGLSDSEIAEELNCTPRTIQMVRGELDLYRGYWKDIDHDELWRDYMSGMSLSKLAEKYGYASVQSVRRAIDRMYQERKQE